MVGARGELDLSSADLLLEAVTRILAGTQVKQVEVDLSEVGFLDSSGIQALMRARRAVAENGGRLSVSGAHGIVAQVLRITAVDQILGSEASSAAGAHGDSPLVD